MQTATGVRSGPESARDCSRDPPHRGDAAILAASGGSSVSAGQASARSHWASAARPSHGALTPFGRSPAQKWKANRDIRYATVVDTDTPIKPGIMKLWL